MNIPEMNDVIYIGPSDDNSGGKAVVSKVEEGISGGLPAIFIRVEQAPGYSFNWEFLQKEQVRLKRDYGNRWARPDHQSNLSHYSLDELKEEIERRERIENK